MNFSEEIDKALAAHGQLKLKLRTAIEKGKNGLTISEIQSDHDCAFGKWFYGLPSKIRESSQAQKIQQLHASFHQEAGRVLELALQGHQDEALLAIGLNSPLSRISGQLGMILTQWKQDMALK